MRSSRGGTMHYRSLSSPRLRGVMPVLGLVTALSCAVGGPDSGDSQVTRPRGSLASHAPQFHESAGGGVVNRFPIMRGVVPHHDEARANVQTPPDQLPTGTGGALTTQALTGGTLVLYDDTGPWGWLGEVYA